MICQDISWNSLPRSGSHGLLSLHGGSLVQRFWDYCQTPRAMQWDLPFWISSPKVPLLSWCLVLAPTTRSVRKQEPRSSRANRPKVNQNSLRRIGWWSLYKTLSEAPPMSQIPRSWKLPRRRMMKHQKVPSSEKIPRSLERKRLKLLFDCGVPKLCVRYIVPRHLAEMAKECLWEPFLESHLRYGFNQSTMGPDLTFFFWRPCCEGPTKRWYRKHFRRLEVGKIWHVFQNALRGIEKWWRGIVSFGNKTQLCNVSSKEEFFHIAWRLQENPSNPEVFVLQMAGSLQCKATGVLYRGGVADDLFEDHATFSNNTAWKLQLQHHKVFYILWQDYNDLIFHTLPLRFREDVVKKELCLLRVLPKFILRYAFRKLLRPWMREKHPCEQQKNPVWWKKWPGNLYQHSTMGIDSKGFMLRICTLLLERSRLLPSRMSWVCRLPWVSGIQLGSHQMAALRTSSDVARLSWSMVEFQCSQQWDT